MKSKSKKFILGFFLSGIIIFFFLLFEKGSTYQNQTLILVKPQKGLTYQDLKIITRDIQIIGETLKIHDKIFETDSFLSGTLAQKTLEDWQKTIQIEILEESSILKINIFDKSEEKASQVATSFLRAFMQEISHNFNIKEEVSLSIIEGPVTFKSFSGELKNFAWISIFSGILFGLILSKISFKKPRVSLPHFSLEKKKKKIDFSKKPSKKSPQNFQEEIQKKTIKENQPKGKTSFAPENLPLAGDEIEKMFGAVKNGLGYKSKVISQEKKSEKETRENQIEETLTREATPEEVKERLNKLLGGV